MWKKSILLIIILHGLNGCATVNAINNAETDSPLFFNGTRLDANTQILYSTIKVH